MHSYIKTAFARALQFALILIHLGRLTSTQSLPDRGVCISGASIYYSGTRNTTFDGLTCQRWDAIQPHRPNHTPADGGHHNYCRNPDQDLRGTWCYTTNRNVRFQYCGIPKCVTDSQIIWTSYDLSRRLARVLSLNADPEYVREGSGASRFNQSANITIDSVLQSTSPNSEYWSLAQDYDGKRFFFADYKSELVGVRHFDTNAVQTYHQGMAHGVEGMAYDWMSGNLYMADSELNWIIATESTFQYFTVVYKAEDPTYALALHGVKRRLFFSTFRSRGSQIISTDLAGKDKQVIFSYPAVNDVSGITVDYDEDRIYWTDFLRNRGLVKSSNLDGTNVKEIYSRSNSIFWGIATYSNYIYFTDVQPKRVNPGRVLLYYIFFVTKARVNDNPTVSHISTGTKPRSIVVYQKTNATSLPSVYPQGECDAPSIAKCAQICLPRLNASRECACAPGYVKTGETGCTQRGLLGESIFFSDSGQAKVFAMPLNSPNNNSYTAIPLGDNADAYYVIANLPNRLLYWYDHRNISIWKSNIDGSNATKINSGKYAQAMTLDPQTGYIYFVDFLTDFIHVMSDDGYFVKTLRKPPADVKNSTNIQSIELDIKNKFIYWTDTNNKLGEGTLRRMRFDGNGEELVVGGLVRPHALAMDYQYERLFLSEATIPVIYEIQFGDLESVNGSIPPGAIQHTFSQPYRVNSGAFITELTVLNNTLYMYDGINRSVEYFNISAGSSTVAPYGPREFFTVRSLQVFSTSYYAQYIGSQSNPCASSADLCPDQQFCLAGAPPGSNCFCGDRFKKVGKRCVDEAAHARNEIPPTHGNTCPENIIQQLPPCYNMTDITWTPPTWTDDKTDSSALGITTPSVSPPVLLGPGLHDFAYTATDEHDNIGHCAFTVTISVTVCEAQPTLLPHIQQSESYCLVDTFVYDITCRAQGQLVTFTDFSNVTLINRCMETGVWAITNFLGITCQAPPSTAPSSSTTTTTTTTTAATTTSTPSSSQSTAISTGASQGPPEPVVGRRSKSLSAGATAAICILVIVLVAILAFVVVLRLRKRNPGAPIMPLFWKRKDDSLNVDSNPFDDPNHYSVM
ncbi:unnamed protein product [Clavelina lepadiformis]|uniref:Uncharacterized protein n=1 Tax=Clavelina lepadiformis TaxID=159417 RepID=A0ABP0FBI4_CLALP